MIQAHVVSVNSEFVHPPTRLVLHDLSTYRGRVARLLGLIASVRGDLTQEELAERMTMLTGRQATQQNASGWLSGARPRERDREVALPKALGADPGWLYHGPDDSAAPAPTEESVAANEERMVVLMTDWRERQAREVQQDKSKARRLTRPQRSERRQGGGA